MQAWLCPYCTFVLTGVFLGFSLDIVAFRERKKTCTLESHEKKHRIYFQPMRGSRRTKFQGFGLWGAYRSWAKLRDEPSSFLWLEYKQSMLFCQMRGKKVQAERLINQLQNIFSKTLILVDTVNLHNAPEHAKKKKKVFHPLK